MMNTSACRLLAAVLLVILTASAFGACKPGVAYEAAPMSRLSSPLACDDCDKDGGSETDGGQALNCSGGESTCEDDKENGKGIYVVEGGNYCIVSLRGWTFCPEAFIPTQGSTSHRITLAGRFRLQGQGSQSTSANISLDSASLVHPLVSSVRKPVTVLGMSVGQSGLVIEYQEPPARPTKLSGPGLERLTLTFNDIVDGTTVHFDLTFKFVGTSAGLAQYNVLARTSGVPPFEQICRDHNAQPTNTSFLSGARIDGLSGIYNQRDSLTMACWTGAIVECLKWGYDPGKYPSAFGACIQAKRAAYFVQFGDYNSYTKNGTHIEIWDNVNVKSADGGGVQPADLEAVWTNQKGAVCLNRDNQRRKDVALPDAGVPPCPSSDMPQGWIFATGLGAGSTTPLPPSPQ